VHAAIKGLNRLAKKHGVAGAAVGERTRPAHCGPTILLVSPWTPRCSPRPLRSRPTPSSRLRQSYLRIAKRAAMMAGRYAHAKQFKRHRRASQIRSQQQRQRGWKLYSFLADCLLPVPSIRFQSFLPALTWAMALAILFAPAHRWVEARLRRPNATSVLSIGLIVVLPLTPGQPARRRSRKWRGHLERQGCVWRMAPSVGGPRSAGDARAMDRSTESSGGDRQRSLLARDEQRFVAPRLDSGVAHRPSDFLPAVLFPA
jgi:hypothetical protein